MEIDEPKTLVCTVLAMDHSTFRYKGCHHCETPIPKSSSCSFCTNISCKYYQRQHPFKRFFRLLFSIATDRKVINVVCFDRAATLIFGCSAQKFFEFATLHPCAAKNSSNALVGELFKVTLTKPKRSAAQNLRMMKSVPLRSHYQPLIKTLEELYAGVNEKNGN